MLAKVPTARAALRDAESPRFHHAKRRIHHAEPTTQPRNTLWTLDYARIDLWLFLQQFQERLRDRVKALLLPMNDAERPEQM